ncbi:hypothetical protein HK099_007452 [Clydaea vesicula]|uniref:Maf-like protein n=1 Tax=Clydaea vesicula TaxID=447962 RepID=A0AAD5TWU0_9FUNG|nr:hypothetical protein HK099_007452 [Clydaea vesicula]
MTNSLTWKEVKSETFPYQIVLGSSSFGRKKVLKQNKINFIQYIPDIDEKAVGKTERHLKPDPIKLTNLIAKAKSQKVLNLIKEEKKDLSQLNYLVICSDQVVSYNGTIREKPESVEECKSMLKVTVTSVVVVNTRNGKEAEGYDIAKQYFNPIPDNVVDIAIKNGDILNCAGGFIIDEEVFYPYLSERVGDESSILGLPLDLTIDLINKVIC